MVNTHKLTVPKSPTIQTAKIKKGQKKLTELLATEGQPLATSDVLCIFYDIFSALKVCHAKGIVHQGICPDNILITQAKNHSLKASLTGFELAANRDWVFSIYDEKTHAIAMHYYESPQILWAHTNPINQNVETIQDGKVTFYHPPLKYQYFSSQSSNHGLRRRLVEYGISKGWCHEPTIFLLTPEPSNDIWAVGILLAECLTGVHAPLLTLDTALNHNIHNPYDPCFNTLVDQCLQLDKDKRISAQDALKLIEKLKGELNKEAC